MCVFQGLDGEVLNKRLEDCLVYGWWHKYGVFGVNYTLLALDTDIINNKFLFISLWSTHANISHFSCMQNYMKNKNMLITIL